MLVCIILLLTATHFLNSLKHKRILVHFPLNYNKYHSMVENNFLKAIKPAVTLCKVLGILPILRIDNNRVVLFKFYFLYNTMLLFLSLWLGFKMCIIFFQEHIVEVITDIMLLVANELQLIVTFAKAIFGTKSWSSLTYAILKVDKLFTELNVQLPDNKLRKRMYVYFSTRLAIIIFALILQVYVASAKPYTVFIYASSMLIFNSVLNCCAALCVSRIQDGFDMLNGLIKERADADGDTSFAVPLKDFLPSASVIHQNLTRMIKKFNESHGIILLTTVTASFLDEILCLHECYKAFKHNDTPTMLTVIAYCCLHASNILLLCHWCEVTIEKVSR